MRSYKGCNCDECRGVEMVLQELDEISPVEISTREMGDIVRVCGVV